MKIDDLKVGTYYKRLGFSEIIIFKLLENPEQLNYQYKAKSYTVIIRGVLIPVTLYCDRDRYFDPNDEYSEISKEDVRLTLKTILARGVETHT